MRGVRVLITIKEYVVPQSIEEAYNYLVSKKNTTLFGGGAFIRMSSKNIAIAIDLSKSKLNYIKETDTTIEIGAMATFGDIERSEILKKYFGDFLASSVNEIVGIQLRNIVTVGATVYSRYGFSDLITGLLALDTKVKLYKQGSITLEDFLENGSNDRDVLESIIIEKNSRKASFKAMRNSKGDYAMLNLALSKLDDQFRISIGARPNRAILAHKTMEYLNKNGVSNEHINKASEILAEEITFGSNKRGSEEYRGHICKSLFKRALTEVMSYEN